MFIAALFTMVKGRSSPVSVDRWMGKQNVVHPCNGIFFCLRKEGQGFPGGAVVGNPPANAGDTG